MLNAPPVPRRTHMVTVFIISFGFFVIVSGPGFQPGAPSHHNRFAPPLFFHVFFFGFGVLGFSVVVLLGFFGVVVFVWWWFFSFLVFFFVVFFRLSLFLLGFFSLFLWFSKFSVICILEGRGALTPGGGDFGRLTI